MVAPETGRAAVIDALAQWIAATELPHPLRVGIDGRTAAGKTTLAGELVDPIARRGRPVIRIGIDDFHRCLADRRQRQELPAWQRYYCDSFDHPAIRAALLPLGPGGDRRYRRVWFNSLRNVPIYEPRRVAPPDAVVLVDGVFLARPELDNLWDLRIFVAIDAEHSLSRGPLRDQAWVGSVAVATERYHTIYIPGEDHYIAACCPHERADAIIDNRNPERPHLRFRDR